MGKWAVTNARAGILSTTEMRCDIKSLMFLGFVVLIHDLCPVSVLPLRLLDIEYEMTMFAFYYVGIGAAVFLLGYFQVGLSLFPHKETHLKLD